MASLSNKSGLSIKARLDDEEERCKLEKHCATEHEEIYELNDFVGPIGFYQVLVMIFASIREAITSFDSVAPSLALPMDDTYKCVINETSNQRHLETLEADMFDPRCYYIEIANETNSILPCTEWIFQERYKNSMLVQWDLVCDKEYLASMVHSSYFIGFLFGTVVWGPLADVLGRLRAYMICHFAYLIFGAAAVFAPNIYWLMLFRFLSAFHAIGYFILYTIQVEMIGAKYRPISNTLNHAGWGLGVVLVPFIGLMIKEWRWLLAVAPICQTLLLPWMLCLPESIRWMILHNKVDKAKKEIKRGARLNRLRIINLDKKIDKFIEQLNSVPYSNASFVDLFTNRHLCKALISLSLVYGILMYIYYSRTLHFAPDEASMFVNFIISGSGEWVSLLINVVCMIYLPRKTCLTLFMYITASSVTFEALTIALMDEVPPVLSYITDGFVKIFAMCAIMVVWLVQLEIFPTILRQRGSAIVLLVGQVCNVIAPFHVLFEGFLGTLKYSLLISIILISLAISIIFCLKETAKMELPDNIVVEPVSAPSKDSALSNNNKKNGY